MLATKEFQTGVRVISTDSLLLYVFWDFSCPKSKVRVFFVISYISLQKMSLILEVCSFMYQQSSSFISYCLAASDNSLRQLIFYSNQAQFSREISSVKLHSIFYISLLNLFVSMTILPCFSRQFDILSVISCSYIFSNFFLDSNRAFTWASICEIFPLSEVEDCWRVSTSQLYISLFFSTKTNEDLNSLMMEESCIL